MSNLILSEVLCYIQNHFSSSWSDNFVTTLIGCYTEDDINEAKELLFDIVDKMSSKVDGLPRYINRLVNKSWMTAVTFSTYTKYSTPWKSSYLDLLPWTCRIWQSFKPGEVDVNYTAVTIANLT